MLLRRVIEHVKTQNWTAIAIDFVIVVTGVFIGIQVANYNEERKLAKQREATVERLHDEAEAIIGYFQPMLWWYDTLNSARSEAIGRMVDNDWAGADLDQMRQGISSITLYPSATPPRSTYDEVISTGLFAELGDPALRKAISDYYSELEFLNGQIDYFRGRRDVPPVWVHPAITLEFAPGTDRERSYVIDFDAISNDTDFIESIIAGNNSIRAIAGWWRDSSELAEAMCAETARISGKPCDPPVFTPDDG